MKNIKRYLNDINYSLINESEFVLEITLGYARVSSREQAVNSHALEQQIQRLKDNGANLIIYDVQTGKKDNRPGLLKVMQLVKEDEITEVIITRLDRLGRSVPLIRKNISVFQETGVNLRVLDQLIDLRTSHGMFMVNLLASLAEMEVDQLSERVKHGKQHRRKQQAACECVPFGYKAEKLRYQLDTTSFLCLLNERPINYTDLSNEEDIEKLPGITIAQLARDCIDIFLRTKGVSRATSEIFQKYGIQHTQSKKNGNDKIFHWTPAGLKRWLKNPVLCGHTVYNKRIKTSAGQRKEVNPKDWQIIYDTHLNDRLISDEESTEILRILEFNSSRPGPALFNYDSSNFDSYGEFAYQRGIVYCAECNTKCITKTRQSKNKYHYYACRHAGKGCNNRKGTRKDAIERALIDYLLHKSVVLQTRDSDKNCDFTEIPIKSEKLKKLETRLAKLEEITDFDPELEALKEKTFREIQEEINPFSSNAIDTKTVDEIIQAGNNLFIWYTLSEDDKVAIYSRLVEKITVCNGAVVSIVLNTSC
ncbi:recombinase family protein [Nostoc sp. FACHB-87]|uniref:fdxN element excision recombinase XisF n=1 Tax=Nostocaceae TaxID=1162 RepID=UPI001688D08F|nr:MULTISPECIES: fdxN element excision recombinase XisF [Nostocaceae]MBD2455224.1 recombinase family protein [Nostoc sp. FACHB-87]MBD2476951.1 recombinase family protein [Anabaena sp. FACHB-83]